MHTTTTSSHSAATSTDPTSATPTSPRGASVLVARSATVETRQGVVLLSGADVIVSAGELVGVVGPSGSGKTTLLEVLAGLRSTTSGAVETIGRDTRLGYVPQDDIVHAELTVEATVRYAARLRLPSATSAADVAAAVDRTLDLLGLTERRAQTVGSLSGGQRKRVSIATELVVRPGVCLLDEPTAGLDPDAAASLMGALRSLADGGTAIVMTTHRLEDLRVADRVIEVAAGGRIAAGAADHDFRHDSPRGSGPAAHAPSRSSRRSFTGQTTILARRNLDLLLRNRMNLAIMAGSPVLVVAMFSVLFPAGAFSGATRDDVTSIAIVYWLAFAGFFFGLTFGLLQICTELPIVRRERLVSIDVGPYLLAKAAVLLPVLAGVDAAMMVTLYMLDRLPSMTAHEAITAWTVLGLDAFAGLTLGLLASASVTSTSQAALALPMLCFPAVLFSGAVLPVASMTPVGAGIAAAVSDRWAFEALARALGVATHATGAAHPAIDVHAGALAGPIGGHLGAMAMIALACAFAARAVLARRT